MHKKNPLQTQPQKVKKNASTLAMIISVALLSACSGPEVEIKPSLPKNQVQALPTYTPSTSAPIVSPPILPAYQLSDSIYNSQLPPHLQVFFKKYEQSFKQSFSLVQLQFIQQQLIAQTPNQKVIQLIAPFKQTLKKNWQIYRSRFIEPKRIQAGQIFWQNNQAVIEEVAQKYQVPSYIIMGILGVETIYGQNMGNFSVLNSLYTLSFYYPEVPNKTARQSMFEQQLFDYLVWAGSQGRFDHVGSYAAAMGMPQFMPTSILKFAVDEDHDGVINLTTSVRDIAGSVANFLRQHGWRPNQSVVMDIPSNQYPFVRHMADGKPQPSIRLQTLKDLGLSVPSNQSLEELALIVDLPSGVDTDYRLGLHNFYVITRYNQSFFYALTVEEFGRTVVYGR
jgi:membrane-bound lytic murein transglycosylase B